MTSFSGWHVRDGILAELFEGNPVPSDKRILENKLCDLDIRDFGKPFLSNCMNKEALTGPVVLQLIRYRNVSQPKLKDGLNGVDDVGRVSLTDGHTSVSAILLDNIKGINSDTPPGTKLLVSGVVNVENGFLILNSSNVTVIGGRVEKLIEKWMIERHSFGDSQQAVRSDYKAPRWISFGKQNMRTSDPSTLEFRANDVLKIASERNTNDESVFKQQRKENIQSVGKGSKVFIAPRVQAPLKSQRSSVTKKTTPSATSGRYVDRCYEKKSVRHSEEVSASYTRPSKPSTLFDFMVTNVASEIAPNSHTPSCASTQDTTFSAHESNHLRHEYNIECSNQQGVARRNPLDKGSNYVQKNGKESASGRTLKPSVKNRQSRQDSRSGKVKSKNSVGSSGVKSYGQKAQHFSDVMRNSVQTQISGKMNHSSIYDRFQRERLNVNAHNSTSQLNVSRKGDLSQDGIIQNFSNICIGNTLPSVVPKKLPASRSHKGSNMNMIPAWNVGDQCKAPWKDGMYYLATIVDVGPHGMCVVRYNDYGNTCTVPQGVLLFERPQH